MNVFITGGTGYIGGALLEQLLKKGDHVRALHRNLSPQQLIRHERLTWVNGTLEDTASLEAGMAGCEGVYHTAAYARVWSKDPSNYYKTNVAGTVNMIEAAKRTGVRKFILTSSAGVTGAGGKTPADEHFQRSGGFLNDYESTKALAEEKAIENAGERLSVSIVRPARVYGPGRESRSNPFLFLIRTIQKAPVFFLPSGSDAVGSYCYLGDIVNGHCLAMQHGAAGERYLLGGENLSYREIIHETIRACGRNIKVIPVPFLFFKWYSYLELLRGKFSNHEPRIVPSWADRFRLDASISSKKAETDLGYIITPFAVGIRKTIASLSTLQHL